MSKFQIVKGITDNLEDTPYVEGKVYFTYEDTESEDISIYADIDGVRRKIKEGVQEEELNNYLLKTDIAAWAKESTKPSYTANEVGALSTSHPAATITTNQITQWNNKSDFSGSYNDLTGKPTIPTKTSELTNDSGFLTEEIDPTVHILTLQEDENEELTTGEDDSISNYIENNELVIIYYSYMPFYLVDFDRGLHFATTNGAYKLYYNNNNHSWTYTNTETSFAYQNEIPTNISDLTNDSGYITEETDPTIHVITLEKHWDADLDAEVISLPINVTYENISTWTNNNEVVILDAGVSESFRYFYFAATDRNELIFVNPSGNQYSVYSDNTVQYYSNGYLYYNDLPTDVSQLNNDAGYITEETDPTVPAWAKESTKPTYTAAEVGALPDTTVIPEDKVFIATYGTTTYADTLAAYNAGKLIFAVYNNGTANGKTIFPLTRKASSFFQFEGRYLNGLSQKRTCELSSSGWTTTSYFGDTMTRTVDVASGDSLIIRDLDDNSTMKSSSLTFGTETNQYLANNGTWQTIPENISDLTNDSGFQTSTEVNSAIATAIGNINQFNVAIVSTLPTENIDAHTIYFMSNGGSDDSIYDEWMYINNNWEKIGTTAVDLSGYMQTSHPANRITSTDINDWNNKANLWDITSGVGSSGNSNIFSINMTNYYSNNNTNFMVFVNRQYLISNLTQVRCTTNSEQLEINKNKIIINGAAAGTYIEPGLYYGTLSAWSNSATLTLTKAPIVSDIPQIYSSTNTTGYLTMDTLPIYDGTVV